METQEILSAATGFLGSLSGHVFDVFSLSRPASVAEAVNLSKILSKLSALIGNLIEFRVVESLNAQEVFRPHGRWVRQDPDFPDTVFEGSVNPRPGVEVKAWFPLSTEITARFRESQSNLQDAATNVCMLAWLPENLLYGNPRVLDVVVMDALSVAVARDSHYHNPPDYLVIEPEDTAARTQNLQQRNVNGYKWQGTPADFDRAREAVAAWGEESRVYKPTREYQQHVRALQSQFVYRLDTNFAKMDRVAHPGIEAFKTRVTQTVLHGMPLREWVRIVAAEDDTRIGAALKEHLAIG